MIAPLARIAARYIAGVLVAYGVFSPADAALLEPEFVALAGALLGFAVEGAYFIAKRKGWTT